MILRVLNLILIVITFGLVEIIDTVTYDEIDNNITVTGYEDYTYREVFGDSLYGVGKTNLIENGDFSNSVTGWTSLNGTGVVTDGVYVLTSDTIHNDYNIYTNSLATDKNGHSFYVSAYLKNADSDYVRLRLQKNTTPYTGIYDDYLYTPFDNIRGAILTVTFDGDFRLFVQSLKYNIIDNDITYIDNIMAFDLTGIFEAENEPALIDFQTMLTEYKRMLTLQPYEQVTTTTNTLDMTDLMISLVSLLCWYGIIKVWKGVRK